MFVGCAYPERRDTKGAVSGSVAYNEEDCVYFVMIRRSSKSDYIRELEEEEGSDSEDENLI